MSICDKINTAGETLEANLTARGISCDFGKNSDGKDTIQDMAEMITASNLRGIGDAIIHISASRPYLLSGEKTDLIVTLHNGVGTPLANKSVTVSDGTSLYSGLTNLNGTFTLYDVTVSANKTYTATYSTVSDSVTIYYSKFADLTGDTSKYIYDSKCNVTSSNNEITVTWVSGTYLFWANKGDTSTEFDYTGDFTVEFDLLSNGGNTTIQIYDNSAATYYSKSLYQLNGSNAGHFKIVKDGQVFKTFVDGVEKTAHQVNSTITGACRVGFRTNSTSTIQFRNFVIYQDSFFSGITNNLGIFTLYDVEVSTTTTFTATYSTVSATCLVEYCVFVDYGVENNYNSDWKKNDYLSISRSATETTLTQTVSGSNGGFYETQNNSFNLPSTCVIEFDCYINTSRRDDGGWMSLRTNSTVRRWIKLEGYGLQYGEWHHYKIELDGTSSKATIDGTSNTVTLTQAANNLVLNVRDDVTTSGGKVEIKYKNFRIRAL